MNNDNLYVITGGPGVGKTSLITELIKRGYLCVPEVAREIIREQVTSGGNAVPWGNTDAYSDLMSERSIDDFIQMSDASSICFFDRGIPDVIGYNNLIGIDVPEQRQCAAMNYRYNSTVFILPPWKEIYETDNERKQTYDEAVATYFALRSAYSDVNYTVIDVPKLSVEERADFLLNRIQ